MIGEDEPINARQIAYDDGTQQGSDVETEIRKKALVNTYYDSINKKLYQVNSDGTQGGEINMGMPTLDYTNYLHIFTSSAPSDLPSGATYGLSFTANKECYLLGSFFGTDRATVKINNTIICAGAGSATGYLINTYIPPIKLQNGDTVAVASSANTLKIYEEL